MKKFSARPAHLVAAAALVAGASWGGASLASADDASGVKPAVPTYQGKAGAAWVYKTKEYTTPISSSGSGIAKCPAGYVVTGGGVQTISIEMAINETRPWDGGDADTKPDDGWISYSLNQSTTQENSATTYAICRKQ